MQIEHSVESSSNANALKALFLSSAIRNSFLVTEMLTTDLAEYLVSKGVLFREMHHVAGAAVRMAEDKNKALSALAFEELSTLHPKFEQDVLDVWNFDFSVERKDVTGGTGKSAVQQQIDSIKAWLS
ncbi:hypothetical protein PsorP6_001898 [Peronosclerospora sorghi]|uniref:Uncharacterized protein n=1 Tax=Peronosclerospora sorghi TaxID=230839 RepID=A0ACC0WXY3_9STRA|nr:hypothetical protein PsorP6_001898 [Peronosclerospora sorghi]